MEKGNMYKVEIGNDKEKDLVIYSKFMELLPPDGSIRFINNYIPFNNFNIDELYQLDEFLNYYDSVSIFRFKSEKLQFFLEKLYAKTSKLVKIFAESTNGQFRSEVKNYQITRQIMDNTMQTIVVTYYEIQKIVF